MVHVLWCGRIDDSSRWRLVSNGADTVRYGSLVNNEDGTPFVIQHESFQAAGLSRAWELEHGLVYELPDALVEQLDDLTEGKSGHGIGGVWYFFRNRGPQTVIGFAVGNGPANLDFD